MRVCPATLENSWFISNMKEERIDYGLISFYYIKDQEHLEKILDRIDGQVLIDSGAHTIQHKNADGLEPYVEEYIEFIKRNTDNPKIEGFFEMDVDNLLGPEKVKEIRRRLESVSDKIIPVWHNYRGVDEYIEMCKEYSGKKVSITGFANGDMFDNQFNLFINRAHQYGCKIHVLGMTRYDVIDNLNLGKDDSVDSSSWKQMGIFGSINLMLPNGRAFGVKSLAGLKSISYKTFTMINWIFAKQIQKYYLPIDKEILVKLD